MFFESVSLMKVSPRRRAASLERAASNRKQTESFSRATKTARCLNGQPSIVVLFGIARRTSELARQRYQVRNRRRPRSSMRTPSISPEGTFFETMRAFFGGVDLTQPALASSFRVFHVPGRGGRTEGTLFELAINVLTARQGTARMT